MTYTDRRRGLVYRIIGFLSDDGIYESYHGRSTKPVRRDCVLHLLRTGNGRRYPNVKQVNGVSVIAQSNAKSRIEQVTPWVGDRDWLKENGILNIFAIVKQW